MSCLVQESNYKRCLKMLIDEFNSYARDISDKTRNAYSVHLRRLPFKSLAEVKQMDDEKLVKVMNDLIRKSPERSRILVRSAYMKLLTIIGKSDLSIRLSKYKQLVRKVRKKFLTFEQIKELVNACETVFPEKDVMLMKLLIMIQYDICSRISAVLNIRYGDIIFENGMPNKIVVIETKVNRLRTVTLSEKTAELLNEYIHKNKIKKGLLFKIPYITVYKKQKKLFRTVMGKDGEKVSSHWFRASRAVHLFWKGYDIETVKRIGDWSSATVLEYLRMSGVTETELMEESPVKW